jgi:hypothetical protein
MSLKTKNALLTSNLKKPIGLKMMVSTIRVNSSIEEEKKLFFLIIFFTYLLIGLLKFQV